jgi:hypothetical protein
MCNYDEAKWICYVFAENRNKARYLFHRFFDSGSGEQFIWVRSRFVGTSDVIDTPTVVDSENHNDYRAVLALCDGYEIVEY